MALSVATAVSALGVVSSINGCITAAENIAKGIDQYRNSHILADLLVDVIHAACLIIVQPARAEYLEVQCIDEAAQKLVKSAQGAKEWIRRYQNKSRIRRYINSEIYEKRFNMFISAVQIHTTNFTQLCFAHSIRTPSLETPHSDVSERFRLDIVDLHDS